jgi:hypothetical protein
VVVGATLVSVFEGFNQEARAAIYAAQAGARRLGTHAAGSEHLLLGVMATGSEASRVLTVLGVAPAEVERAVARQADPSIAEDRTVQGAKTCLPIFETCLYNRIDHGGAPIRVEYMTMALTYEHYGEAAQILADLTGAEPSVIKVMVVHRPGFRTWNEPAAYLPNRPIRADDGGSYASPEQVVLDGFLPGDGARVVGVGYELPTHAVVQVGFPGKEAFYWFNAFRQDNGWRLERRR